MSFAKFKELIEEGDTVILYIGVTQMLAIKVEPFLTNKHGMPVTNTLQTIYGALNVMDLVGLKFGSKVKFTKGYGYALYPTPELWTQTLPHRTQILYTPDISMVMMELNIGVGSIICEAGTGSGSLSHAFLRTIGQEGHLYTCDFHEKRVEEARKEFECHGHKSRVTIERRDVCAEGWGVTGLADAVFLDLPKPWEALAHAVEAIKTTGGRVCSFSPCVEQVSKTSECMRELGLTNINTVENLQRELQFRMMSLPHVSIKQTPLEDLPVIKNVQNKRRRLNTDSSYQSNGDEETNKEDSNKDENNSSKELKKEENNSDKDTSEEDNNSLRKVKQESNELKSENSNGTKVSVSETKFRSAIPLLKMPGHTGFLTFATVPPLLRR